MTGRVTVTLPAEAWTALCGLILALPAGALPPMVIDGRTVPMSVGDAAQLGRWIEDAEVAEEGADAPS